MSYVSAQFWANALKSFVAKATNNIIYAADLNEATDEIEALEQILGTGLRTKSVVSWDSVSTSWSTATARLNNLDAGVRTSDVTIHPQYALVSGALIQPADTTSVALTIHGNTGNTHDLVQVVATDTSSVLTLGQGTVAIGKATTINSSLTVTSGLNVSGGGALSVADIATRVPLIAKGAASQSVNLLEAQNSAGSALFAVNQNGVFGAAGGFITNTTAGAVPLTVRGAAGQSVNLAEWQNSAGTNKAYIDQNGNMALAGNVNTNAGLSSYGGTASFISDTASRVPVLVQGVNGQWANLIEFKDYLNNIKAYVAADGSASFPNIPIKFAQGSSAFLMNVNGDASVITGLTTISGFVAMNGDGLARANVVIAKIGTTGGTVNIRAWSGATGAVVANLNVRIDWLAWGT